MECSHLFSVVVKLKYERCDGVSHSTLEHNVHNFVSEIGIFYGYFVAPFNIYSFVVRTHHLVFHCTLHRIFTSFHT